MCETYTSVLQVTCLSPGTSPHNARFLGPQEETPPRRGDAGGGRFMGKRRRAQARKGVRKCHTWIASSSMNFTPKTSNSDSKKQQLGYLGILKRSILLHHRSYFPLLVLLVLSGKESPQPCSQLIWTPPWSWEPDRQRSGPELPVSVWLRLSFFLSVPFDPFRWFPFGSNSTLRLSPPNWGSLQEKEEAQRGIQGETRAVPRRSEPPQSILQGVNFPPFSNFGWTGVPFFFWGASFLRRSRGSDSFRSWCFCFCAS